MPFSHPYFGGCPRRTALPSAARSGFLDDLFSPIKTITKVTPVASFILLVLLWSDRDWVPVVISALMVVPVVWASVRQGIDGVDRQLLELAHVYRFDRWKTLRLVWLPAVKAAFNIFFYIEEVKNE